MPQSAHSYYSHLSQHAPSPQLAAYHAQQRAIVLQRTGILTVGSAEDDNTNDRIWTDAAALPTDHHQTKAVERRSSEGIESFSVLLNGQEGGAAPRKSFVPQRDQGRNSSAATPVGAPGGAVKASSLGYDDSDLDAFMKECIHFGVPNGGGSTAAAPADDHCVPSSAGKTATLAPPVEYPTLASGVQASAGAQEAPLGVEGVEADVLAALEGDLDLSFLDNDDDLFAGLDL